MRFASFFAVMMLLPFNVAFGESVQPPMMVEYPFLCPSCSESRTISVRYATDGASILETHASSDQPQLAPANDDSEYLPGELVSGPITDNQVGIVRHWEGEIGTNFIEVSDSPGLEPGVRYVDEDLTPLSDKPGAPSWRIEDLSINISETADTATVSGFDAVKVTADVEYVRSEFKADGSLDDRRTVEFAYELWLSGKLPYTPLPYEYEPFKGNHVPPFMAPPIEDFVIASLRTEVRRYGGLVRAAVTAQGENSVLELSSARNTPEPPMDKFASLPVVSSSQVDQFSGPLFLTSLLRQDVLNTNAPAEVVVDDRALDSTSAWKINDSGDLVILLSAENENTSLFLVRPVSGMPEPGRYDVVPKVSSDRLRSMSAEELQDHARKFQLYGVIVDGTLPTVVTGFQSGAVTIEQSGDGLIRGTARGTASILPTDELSAVGSSDVRVSFEAAEGLESFQFRSVESRLKSR